MNDKHILGVDIAKATFHYRLQKASGEELEAGSWGNTPEQIARFVCHLSQRFEGRWKTLHVGMEATGRYGHALFLALHQAGAWVSVLNPAQVKFFAASLNQRGKSDPMDSALIARYVRERSPRATVPVESSLARLKELVGEIDSLVEESVRLSNRLGEVGAACPEVAASLHRRQKLAAEEIQKLEKLVAEIIASDDTLAQRHRLLCTIKGIASRSAARVLAHLAGKGFQSAREMAAYAGLTPRQNTSGTSLRGKTRLCKQGNPKLRKALYLPALVMWKHCPEVRRWADAIALRTGSKKAALGAVMRKLTHVIFGVLKHQKPFDPSFLSAPVADA